MVKRKITQVKFYLREPSQTYGGNFKMSFLIYDVPYIIRDDNENIITEGVVVGNGAPVAGESDWFLIWTSPMSTREAICSLRQLLLRVLITIYYYHFDEFLYTDQNYYHIGTTIGVQCASYEIYEGNISIRQVNSYLPMVTFTYEPTAEPTEKSGAPTFHGYTEDGIHAYFVEIVPTEESTIYYRVQYTDGTWTEWAEYTEILSFTGNGKHRVEAYAIAQGKAKSEEIAYEFVVSPATGIDEVASGKQVADVRYFNMAGQEMQQAEGLTLVVTTYSDGTTSAVKVVK